MEELYRQKYYKLSSETEKRNYYLDSVEMCNSHTTENVVEVINNVLVKHKMNMELLSSVVADNNRVMKKIGKDIEQIMHKKVIVFGCISHIINLISKKHAGNRRM